MISHNATNYLDIKKNRVCAQQGKMYQNSIVKNGMRED